ncbi:MAG: UDP-N-acetylmuramoyl-tripeptide--D-alanyl-D-alanine ligase [Paludibacteraceae bacterium]|nr:UDP-N-acetylmuramoyl-tripeptide--D-alanyl-D-alanine ligase [Paludibacteraceae bacterium]
MDWNFLIKSNTDFLCVTTDSRNITPGCVFFALKGERFNGNLFATQAIEKGAAYAIVDEEIPATCSQKREYKGQIVRVDNSLLALQDLARTWRQHLNKPVIGITGTNGKTTTKELLAAVLSRKYNVHYTQGNLNNAIGVPLTLLQLRREHELAIVEMGASHPGDINELVEIACPNYGLITNVGEAHLEGFGSPEGVKQTKKELYDYLCQHNGTVFLNEDNPSLRQMLEDAKQQFASCSLSVVGYRRGVLPEGVQLVGGYNAENVSAAICVGGYFGVSHEEALEAVRSYKPSNNRSQAMQTKKNRLVVDAYNANPTSMQAAIESFTTITDDKTPAVYILGAMRELGVHSKLAHQNIVNMLAERKAEEVILVGKEWRDTTAPYIIYDDTQSLYDALQKEPLEGKHILLKGSHSVGLEKLLEVL